MSEQIKGIVRGKGLELERAPSLPEGSKVLLTVEALVTSEEERRQAILDLCGAWKNDLSLPAIFAEIAEERRHHKEREVRIG